MAFASLIERQRIRLCWRYYSVPAERWPSLLTTSGCGDYFADGASGADL